MTFGRLVLTWALKDRKGAKETERRLPSQLSKEFEDLGLPLKPSETWGSKSSRIYFKRVGGFICPLCPWLWSEREESNRTPTTLPDLGASLSTAWWSTHPWRWKSLWIVRHPVTSGLQMFPTSDPKTSSWRHPSRKPFVFVEGTWFTHGLKSPRCYLVVSLYTLMFPSQLLVLWKLKSLNMYWRIPDLNPLYEYECNNVIIRMVLDEKNTSIHSSPWNSRPFFFARKVYTPVN